MYAFSCLLFTVFVPSYNLCIHEGKATRLAELALIFIPIYNVAVSDTSHSKL